MNFKLRVFGIIIALATSIFILLLSEDTVPPLPNPESLVDYDITILGSNLVEPRSVDIAKDGTIFIAEKSGKIRIIVDDILLKKPLVTFSTVNMYDAGLLSIVLHPNSTSNKIMYAFYTYEQDGNLWNRISKITIQDNTLTNVETILDRIPGSYFTPGGVLKFGPDKMLYLGTGSISDNAILAQDKNSLIGKILRISPTGDIPIDNPNADSYVYALGMRDPRGFGWDLNGTMYATDTGPGKNDEINVIYASGNYGWPHQQCTGHVEYNDALICYDPSLGIAGIAVLQESKHVKILATSLQTANLYLIDLSNPEKNPQALLGSLGRIRDVIHDQNGTLYVLTSNTDSKGFSDNNDDKLVRIKLKT
ncbi:MAG: glucose sorbosone dehydrogenase [Cenarchaeum symbiont of Oopsacas minuta]|nr:glucose sorbosone dehydrogenase [Cenarchaeum symbiont of Oopsacas minuta]